MDVPAFLSGITFAASAYKAAVELRDEAQIAAATHELQAQLVIAGAHCLDMNAKVASATESERALKTRVTDLEEQIAELVKRVSDRERYELVEDYPGTFALKLKEACRNGEPVHYLCPTCMDNRAMKSTIQFKYKSKIIGTCYECSKAYRFADNLPINVSKLAGGSNGWMGR